MMRTILIDDEPLARDVVKHYLSNFPDVEVVAECSDGFEGIKAIAQHQPDFIFLDIQMPKISGFEMLELVEKPPAVIFTTAFDEYAIKAFEVNALDYLLKPIQSERLEEAINKFISPEVVVNNSQKLGLNDQVFVKDGEKCWFVKLANVPMFESEGNYVRVYFENNKPLILKSLNNLANKLDENVFFRANRKYIINLNWVDTIENWFNGGLMVKLKTGDKIEISRRQASRLKDMKSL